MPMPRERPVLSKRRIMWPPFSSSRIYDSTKAFRESRVIYLSDYGINQECQRNFPIYFGKMKKKSQFNSQMLCNKQKYFI